MEFDLNKMVKHHTDLLYSYNELPDQNYGIDSYSASDWIICVSMELCHYCEMLDTDLRCDLCGCWVHWKCVQDFFGKEDEFICDYCLMQQ